MATKKKDPYAFTPEQARYEASHFNDVMERGLKKSSTKKTKKAKKK